MVTAGVFLVCRCSPLFEHAPDARAFVCVIGAITAFFAATIGLAQNDIKRVIAYSTCSQLGYMFFAAGLSAYGASMFHLFTHAFFKALLFLGSGSVIHAMGGEQDMRKMGGLASVTPITFVAMLVGTIALTGLGAFGIGFAGYYSKGRDHRNRGGIGNGPRRFCLFPRPHRRLPDVDLLLASHLHDLRRQIAGERGSLESRARVSGDDAFPLGILAFGAIAAGGFAYTFIGGGRTDVLG